MTTDNVISIFSNKEKEKKTETPKDALDIFKEALSRYQSHKEFLAKERARNNQNTKREYRLRSKPKGEI